jgi:hypothetical protein
MGAGRNKKYRVRVLAAVCILVLGAVLVSWGYENVRSWRETRELQNSKDFGKVWAHRVDSIGKLGLAEKVFSGVEVNLVFQSGNDWFDVGHPPAKSINLSLEEYLSAAPADMNLWFDLKNLTLENQEAVVRRLRVLFEQYRLGERFVVVESNNYEGLQYLSRNGFYTSYYLPYLKLDKMSKEEKADTTDRLVQQARFSEARAISFPGYMYGYVKHYMQGRLDDIDLLTWFNHKQIDVGEDAIFLKKFIRDDRLKVVLVGFAKDSEFHR